jgi:hypothetical protein
MRETKLEYVIKAMSKWRIAMAIYWLAMMRRLFLH